MLILAFSGGVFTWVAARSLATGAVVFALLFITLETLLIAPRMRRKQRLRESNIVETDAMSGQEFEEYLAALFQAQGYSAQLTPTYDFGASLILEGDGERTLVQANQRTRGDVGLRAVQGAHTAMGYYQATRAVVITNRHFTTQAITLAKANLVELWDRERLAEEILQAHSYGSGSLAA